MPFSVAYSWPATAAATPFGRIVSCARRCRALQRASSKSSTGWRCTAMRTALLPDGLWDVIEPLLTPPKPNPKRRTAASPRSSLPQGHSVRSSQRHSLGDVASGVGLRFRYDLLETLARLAGGGIWDLIHFALLDWLSRYSRIDWSRAVVDSCSVRAVFGGLRRDQIQLTERNLAVSVT